MVGVLCLQASLAGCDGEKLFSAGDEAKCMYFVNAGSVVLSDADGKQVRCVERTCMKAASSMCLCD